MAGISQQLRAKYESRIAQLEAKMGAPLSPVIKGQLLEQPSELVRQTTPVPNGISPKEYAALLRMTEQIQQANTQTNVIEIPGWDDIFQLVERDDGAILDVGLGEWLSNEMQFNVDPTSPQPEFLQHISTIMTIADDVQDFISTMALVGYEIAAVLTRTNKVIRGGILNGNDAINGAFVLSCVTGKKGKGKQIREKELRDLSTRERVVFPSSSILDLLSAAIAKELLIGQVTLEIFGYGIRLGPLVGMAIDTIFALPAFVSGEPVTISFPAIGDLTATAAKIALELPFLIPFLGLLTPLGMLSAAATTLAAHEILAPLVTITPRAQRMQERQSVTVQGVNVWNAVSGWVTETISGKPPGTLSAVNSKLQQSPLSIQNWIDQPNQDAVQGFQDAILRLGPSLEGELFVSFVKSASLLAIRWFEDVPDTLTRSFSPIEQMTLQTLQSSVMPVPTLTYGAYRDTVISLAAQANAQGKKLLPQDVIDQALKDAAGLP